MRSGSGLQVRVTGLGAEEYRQEIETRSTTDQNALLSSLHLLLPPFPPFTVLNSRQAWGVDHQHQTSTRATRTQNKANVPFARRRQPGDGKFPRHLHNGAGGESRT